MSSSNSGEQSSERTGTPSSGSGSLGRGGAVRGEGGREGCSLYLLGDQPLFAFIVQSSEVVLGDCPFLGATALLKAPVVHLL